MDSPLFPDLEGEDVLAELLSDLNDNTAPGSALTDFPDDPIAASLAAFSSRDDDGDLELQALLSDRQSLRTPGMGLGMRTSFSMNDLTVLQHHMPGPSWNQNKLASVKPKLQSVPEGGPSNGGPLNLMPLPGANQMPIIAENGHSNGNIFGHSSNHMGLELEGVSTTQGVNLHQGIPGLDPSLDDYVDFDSEGPGGVHKQLPSTGSLAQQLQMTHVNSQGQIAGMERAAQAMAGLGGYAGAPGSMHPGMQPMTAPSIFAGANSQFSHSPQQALDPQQQQQQQQGGHQVKRSATGLPLRKSQSAVELGSWRSFSGGDEMWDWEGAPGDAKAWKLTPEERLHRIQRYREKRLQRNYSKGVKYQCRKSLADSRPRVRGRFARNDDAGIAFPHDPKKLARERDRSGSGSQEVSEGSSGATSSGGAPAVSMPLVAMATQQLVHSPQGTLGTPQTQMAANSMFSMTAAAAARASSLPVVSLPQPASHLASSAMQGVSMVGATPATMLHGGMSRGSSLQAADTSTTMGPPGSGSLMYGAQTSPGGYGAMPPVIGPSSSGGIFTGTHSSSTYDYSSPPMLGSYQGAMSAPMPYMPSGQTIFTGQTIFSGSSLKLHPPSGTASAQPSTSPPFQEASPTASDSQSRSFGLSLGELSVGHSM